MIESLGERADDSILRNLHISIIAIHLDCVAEGVIFFVGFRFDSYVNFRVIRVEQNGERGYSFLRRPVKWSGAKEGSLPRDWRFGT